MPELNSSSASKKIMIGIAEMVISNNPEELLIAANLGSCLGVTVYDPVLKVGGLIHCLLPLSKSDQEKAKANPCMYVDTGVVMLLSEVLSKGAKKENLIITVAGGASINDSSNVFEIGKKNFTIFRKVMWKNNLLITAQDVGDHISRTLSLSIATGEVLLRKQGTVTELSKGISNGI